MSTAEFRARVAPMGLVEHPATTEAATEARDQLLVEARERLGERHCPDRIAARLHWPALVIDQLEGSTNSYGIRPVHELAQSARIGMVAS